MSDRDTHNNTVLHHAAASGNLEEIRLCLSTCPELLDEQNAVGATALFFAAAKNHGDAVKLLLQFAPNLEIANEHDATPLFMAAREGFDEVAKMLLEAGADPNSSNKNGVTPHAIAKHRNHEKTASLIASYARRRRYDRSQDVVKKILKKGRKHG